MGDGADEAQRQEELEEMDYFDHLQGRCIPDECNYCNPGLSWFRPLFPPRPRGFVLKNRRSGDE